MQVKQNHTYARTCALYGIVRGAFVAGALALAGLTAGAEPSVSVRSVTTGDPWSMITVGYVLGGTDASIDYKVAFDVTANGVTKGVTNAPTKLTDGAATQVIDTAALFGTAKADPKARVRVTLIAVKSLKSLGGVQLWENGPYWAECNVGATKPEEYGYYFWWGDTVGYAADTNNATWKDDRCWDGVTWVSSMGTRMSSSPFESSTVPTYGKTVNQLQSLGYIDSTGNLVAAHDAATAHLGAPWRMPTDAEMSALISNCTTTWITTNGVYGQLVTGKGAFASKSIFLPAAGFGYVSRLSATGSDGGYWSSTPDSDDYSRYAWGLFFNSGNFHRSYYYRYLGHSVRPLRGFAK